MKWGEFFIELGVKANLPAIKAFTSAINSIPLEAASVITAIAGIEYSLAKLLVKTAETAVGLQVFQSETGLSTQSLQKWQLIAQQANISAESVTSSIMNIQRNVAAIKMGGGNIAPFQVLGIDPRQNPFQILEKLRKIIKGLPEDVAAYWLAQMGVSTDMMQVFKLTDEEFNKLSHTVTGLTDVQIKSFSKVVSALKTVGLQGTYAFYGIVSNIKQAIEQSGKFDLMLRGIRDVAIAIGIYFFPVTAAIVGLVLALNDLANFILGKDSVMGKIIDWFKDLNQAVSGITKGIGTNTLKLPALASAGGLPLPFLSGLLGAGGGAGEKNVNSGNVINIVLNAAGNPLDIGNAVSDAMRRLFGDAEHNVNGDRQ